MAKSTDLTGKRFGMLTVLERMPEQQDHYWVWRCRCDCGGEVLVNTKRLTRGTVTNCGCIPKGDARQGSLAEDLTGQRFGLLTVLRRAPNERGRTCWLCRCDCGNTHITTAQNLKAGKTSSCGCLSHQKNIHISDIADRRFGRLTALYATEKRDTKGSVYWHCRCDCGTEVDVTEDGLVHGNYRSCGCLKKEIQMDIPNQLHHIDGTCVEWLEKRKHRKDNTSGFRGVYNRGKGQFRVSIGFKKKRFYVGTYHTLDDAIAARLEEEALIHNQFVKAYYRWKEITESEVENQEIPLVFEVKKENGHFIVDMNMDVS